MAAVSDPGACEEVAAAERLAAEACARAAEIEAERNLPLDLARRFAEAGMFGVCVPARYGGRERAARDVVRVIEAVSRGDGAAGWCVMIGATTGLLAASLPEEWAAKIYGANPCVITGGVVAANGRAREVPGGHLVTGRWPFGSGVRHSDWVVGGTLMPSVAGAGEPEARLMFFEPQQLRVLDTWRASGLRGTGSHDFEVEEVFVPEGRSVVLGGRPRVEGALYEFPTLGLLALGVSAVALGIARHAIEAFVELAAAKTPTGSTRTLANRPVAQRAVADAEASLRGARAFLFEAIDEAQEIARRTQLDPEVKARLRLAATHAAWQSAGATDLVYHAAGGTSVYDASPLSRCFRDVHVATQHIMVAEPTLEFVGRVLLGLGARDL
jgi:alkylation response protein AidB-like acyl-CoA dehydrogenase